MNPIRPSLPPVVQPNAAPKSADAARLAAQKAFFDIAMGKAPATTAAAPVPARAAAVTAAPVAVVQRAAQAPAEQPARPLRPGSLLDIRV